MIPDLKPLPAACYTGTSVDLELLHSLFKARSAFKAHDGRPSTFSKKISKLIQNEVPRRHNERLALIGRYLPNERFRADWYKEVDRGRNKGGWLPFYQLVATWIEESISEIGSDDDGRTELWFCRDNNDRKFFEPSKIPVFLKFACSARIDPKTTALYLWAFAEAAAVRKFAHAQFGSEGIYSDSEDGPTVAEYSSKVKALFSEPSKMIDTATIKENIDGTGGNEPQTETTSREIIPEADPRQSSSALDGDVTVGRHHNTPISDAVLVADEATAHDKSSIDDSIESKELDSLRNALTRIRHDLQTHLSNVDELTDAATKIKRTPESSAIINSLIACVEKLKARWMSVLESMDSYDNQFEDCLKSLGLRTIGRETLVKHMASIKPKSVGKWLKQEGDKLDSFDKCEKYLVCYGDRLTALKKYDVPEKWEGPFEGLSALTQWLEANIESGEKLYQSLVEIDTFRQRCADSSTDPNWNPLREGTLQPEDWRILCSQSQKSTVPTYVIGVAARQILQTGSTDFSSFTGSLLHDPNFNHGRACEILSVLDRQQLEMAWDNERSIRPSLTMCVLNSWLNACNNRETAANDYWYWSPLNEISTHDAERRVHIADGVDYFLSELKTLALAGGIRGSDSLKRSHGQASIGDENSDLWIKSCYKNFTRRVLTPPRNSGSNYGRLALAAYEDLFLPLKDALVADQLDRVRSQFAELRDQFDFGNWFQHRCMQMYPHGSVASEHKKKIQQYIDSGFRIFDDWVSAESEVPQGQDDQFRTMNAAIDELIRRYDQQDLDSEKSFLSNIGWWAHSVRTQGTVPVLSAGNPVGSIIDLPIPLELVAEHQFPWRCIEAQEKGSPPTWNTYVADALSWWGNVELNDTVLRKWQDDERLDCLQLYLEHSEKLEVAIPNEITHWLVERQAALKKILIADFKETHSKLGAFKSEFNQLFIEELDHIKHGLDSGYYYGLEERIATLKKEVDSALESYGDKEERLELSDQIKFLGGQIRDESKLIELEEQFKKLLDSAKNRMKHIEILKALLLPLELPEKAKNRINQLIQELSHPRHLPDPSRSEELELILGGTFSNLSQHLGNPTTLLPEYYQLLIQVLHAVLGLLARPELLLEPNSDVEQLLIEVSDNLEKDDSFDSPEHTKQFLKWLTTRERDLSPLLIDTEWDSRQDDFGDRVDELTIRPVEQPNDGAAAVKARRTLINALIQYSGERRDGTLRSDCEDGLIIAALEQENWAAAVEMCAARTPSEIEGQITDFVAVSSGLALNYLLISKDRDEVVEALLILVNQIGTRGEINRLSKPSQQTAKNPFGTIAASWIFEQDVDRVSSWQFDEDQFRSSAIRLARVLGESYYEASAKLDSPILDVLWDYASRETWSGDFRCYLLRICTKGEMLSAVKLLLQKDPIRMVETRAKLLADLIGKASDVDGAERLRAFLDGERNKQTSKPFALYAEQLLTISKRRTEVPVKIGLVGQVEKKEGKNLWAAVIEVVPSVLDPPQDIELRVPTDSPVLFGPDRKTKYQFSGPFLERKEIRVTFNIRDTLGGIIRLDVNCRVKTLQDVIKDCPQTLEIVTSEAGDNFTPPSPTFVEECFDGFPHNPMRGIDFVPRDSDEKTIEDMLFNSKSAGSLWITSPRRSGKTSMLYRILDEFSYKNGRDDIILYFTLSSEFKGEKEFNKWVWNRILGPDNKALKEHVPDLVGIGKKLDNDMDVDIYLSQLAEKLLESSPPGARVYFVIDEMDRFAEMYLAGAEKKEKVNGIMWQLRHLISRDDTVGILFAGSHASHRFFVSDSEAPFYNSISAITLEPFSVDTSTKENRTRQIVKPNRLDEMFTIPNDTLRHLLRITAGIPYYMKLLAGATLACAKHTQIFPADVNEGVKRMLAKETGINAIDMLENPGEDDLRTLYAESTSEKALIRGVLLAVADIRSPISGHPVNVGEIWSEKSALVVRAGLSREIIRPALKSARDMGFLTTQSSSEYEVGFAIPLLGESMRKRFNTLWAEIDHHLEKLEGE